MSPAQPWGGAHSPRPPGAASPWRGRATRPSSLRALGLFFWPTPLLAAAVFALLSADPLRMAGALGAWALLILGAGLTRTGLAAAAAYRASAVARPPAFPRKLFGAVCTGLGVVAAAWLGGGGMVAAAGFGALAAVLHVAAFGPDPMRAKGLDGLSGPALEDAVARIETARGLVDEMDAAAASLADRDLAARVSSLAGDSRALIDALATDPEAMRRARRFLAVYLVGARDATVKFAARGDDADEAEAAAFAALLDDLAAHVARRRAARAEAGAADLDVEIAVLRDRLRLEGV